MTKRYYPIVFNVQFITSKSLFLNKATRLYSLLLVMFLCVGMAQAQIVFDNSPGSGAPPATLGPYTMTSIPETRADRSLVSTIASPLGGDISLSSDYEIRTVGSTWASVWASGYTGKIYFSGNSSVVLTMPANTKAFYFYAQPDQYGTFDISAQTQDGTSSGPQAIVSSSPPLITQASYFGFYVPTSSPSTNIVTITISITGIIAGYGFGFGQMGINSCSLPNITQEPVAQKICNGQGLSLSVAASPATSYQWKLNGVDISGANASTYAIPVVATNQLGTYSVAVSNNSATCAVRSANVIVEAKVSHFLQFQGCNCGGGGPLKVSIVGGTSPYSFEYMTSGGPSTFANYLSGTTVTLPQNITQGRAISVTDALGCKSID
jgi:hypothetical protein